MEQQQRQGAGVFVAEEDISRFVFGCLCQKISKSLTQKPRKLPVVVSVEAPSSFHAFLWGTTEPLHYKTVEALLDSPFPANMIRKDFSDGGYAKITPAVTVSYNFNRLRTEISLRYQVFNAYGTLQWPHEFNQQHLDYLLQRERERQREAREALQRASAVREENNHFGLH
ncbi:hypothetical protein QOT17_022903 [Balamuthia mandrillaris]